MRQKPAQPQDEPFTLTQEERKALAVAVEFYLNLTSRPTWPPVSLLLELSARLEEGAT